MENELDEFLRHSPLIAAELASFLATPDHPGPQFCANNLIVDVSFTAAHLRAITGHSSQVPGTPAPDAVPLPLATRA